MSATVYKIRKMLRYWLLPFEFVHRLVFKCLEHIYSDENYQTENLSWQMYANDAAWANYKTQGAASVLKGVADSIVKLAGGEGKGVLIVDDLVDTGKTARIVRDILPRAHFATVYAKPMGRPMVDTYITEVSQDTWIYFPWDMGLTFQPPIRNGAAG